MDSVGTYTFTGTLGSAEGIKNPNGLTASIQVQLIMQDKSASDMAAEITKIPAPAKDDKKLTLPEVDEGFTLSIAFSSDESVIDLDGNIIPQDKDTDVKLVLTVTRSRDSSKADTAELMVTVPAKSVTPPTGLRTEILEYVIELAEKAVEDGKLEHVIETVTREFNKALDRAKEVLEDAVATPPTVSQKDIDEAQSRLLKIMTYLEFKGDKTTLGEVIKLAEKFVNNEKIYMKDSYAKFKVALDNAKEVMNTEDMLEEDIIPAWKNLLKAMAELRVIPNKENLEGMIKNAEAVDQSQYTTESTAVLNGALAKAKAVLDDENVDQDTVDAAEQALADALAGLVAVTADDQRTVDTTNTGTNGAGGASNTKTSDNAPIALALFLASMSGLAVFRFKKRR